MGDAVDDEYDSYIGKIYALIRDGADDRKLSSHLLKLETSSMGLRGSSDEYRRRVVGALRSLDLAQKR